MLQVELTDPDKMAAREKKFGKPLTAGGLACDVCVWLAGDCSTAAVALMHARTCLALSCGLRLRAVTEDRVQQYFGTVVG
jgi:hypothetical protein